MDRLKFSSLLIELRKEKDLTQQDFAEIFNVTFQAVSKWETGESLPDINTLEKISNFYCISINDLLNGKRTKIVAESIKAEKTDNESKNMNVNIVKIVFSACAIVVCLLICLLPFFTAYVGHNFYVVSNFYQVAFSSNMLYGNFILLLGFIIFITACVFGIFSGVFQDNKAFYKLEQTFSLFYSILMIAYNIIYINDASVGFYLLSIYGLTYFLIVLFVKPFNKASIKENPDKLLWFRSAFVAFILLFSINWLVVDGAPIAKTILTGLIVLSTIVVIAFHIVSFFKKNKGIQILFYISLLITMVGFVSIILFVYDSAVKLELAVVLLLTIALIVLETVINKVSKETKNLVR